MAKSPSWLSWFVKLALATVLRNIKKTRWPMPLLSICGRICSHKPLLIAKMWMKLLSKALHVPKNSLNRPTLFSTLSPSNSLLYLLPSKDYLNSRRPSLSQVTITRTRMFRTRRKKLRPTNIASTITKEQRKDRFDMLWSECLFGESSTMVLTSGTGKQLGTPLRTQHAWWVSPRNRWMTTSYNCASDECTDLISSSISVTILVSWENSYESIKTNRGKVDNRNRLPPLNPQEH